MAKMNETMHITLLQTDIKWGEPAENISQVEKIIHTCKDTDLFVLPEMWSTGFATKPENMAHEEDANEALLWMRHMAAERQCAVCGSLAVHLRDGSYRNRQYFIDGRNGHEVFYDKHHLFTYGGENRYYTPGQSHTIVEYEGFRILLLTCYDLRVKFVKLTPYDRGGFFRAFIVRRIENQAYLVGVNRVGDDEYSHYVGASCVIDPIGKRIGQCHYNQVEAMTVEVKLEEVRRRRLKFRVLDDRD